MSEVNGREGVWAYVRGGMGEISNSLAKRCVEAGAKIHCNSTVSRIILDDHHTKATGVQLANGELIEADLIIANCAPTVAFSSAASRLLIMWARAISLGLSGKAWCAAII